MADPIALLDRQARTLYQEWCASPEGRRARWNPFNGARVTPAAWSHLSNHERETWRVRALAALRSDDTLADELRREEKTKASP